MIVKVVQYRCQMNKKKKLMIILSILSFNEIVTNLKKMCYKRKKKNVLKAKIKSMSLQNFFFLKSMIGKKKSFRDFIIPQIPQSLNAKL